jgi:protein phosphatase 2C
MKLTIAVDQGLRPYMEDTYSTDSITSGSYALLGVYDGHGGAEVSAVCKQAFPAYMELILKQDGGNNIAETLEKTYANVDAHVFRNVKRRNVGSTAVNALITSSGMLHMANAGDSLGMIVDLQGNGILMSEEHKVEKEKIRIEEAGGHVTYGDGCARVFGTLNVSRSIGDHFMRPYVISKPYISPGRKLEKGEYVILASDGIWDVLSVEEIANIIHHYVRKEKNDVRAVVSGVVQLAKKRGSSDNITFMAAEI